MRKVRSMKLCSHYKKAAAGIRKYLMRRLFLLIDSTPYLQKPQTLYILLFLLQNTEFIAATGCQERGYQEILYLFAMQWYYIYLLLFFVK